MPSNVSAAILVFARTQSGNTPPRRVIQGVRTHLDSPQGVAVDNKHNELVVSNDTRLSVLVFDRAATGNVAPIRVISGPNTSMLRPRQIQLDTQRDELVLADRGLTQEFVYDTPGFLAVWKRTDSGDVAPKKMIRGTRSQLTSPRAVYVDMKNGEYGAGDTTSHSIMVYPRDFSEGHTEVIPR